MQRLKAPRFLPHGFLIIWLTFFSPRFSVFSLLSYPTCIFHFCRHGLRYVRIDKLHTHTTPVNLSYSAVPVLTSAKKDEIACFVHFTCFVLLPTARYSCCSSSLFLFISLITHTHKHGFWFCTAGNLSSFVTLRLIRYPLTIDFGIPQDESEPHSPLSFTNHRFTLPRHEPIAHLSFWSWSFHSLHGHHTSTGIFHFIERIPSRRLWADIPGFHISFIPLLLDSIGYGSRLHHTVFQGFFAYGIPIRTDWVTVELCLSDIPRFSVFGLLGMGWRSMAAAGT